MKSLKSSLFTIPVLLGLVGHIRADSLMVSTFTPSIQQYNATTGASEGTFVNFAGQSTGIVYMTFGPNGNLYSGYSDGIHEWNGTTGASLGVFANPGALGSGALEFGPNGNLYTHSTNQDIGEYNGTTGAYMGVVVPQDLSIMRMPNALAFGPDGTLYVGGQTESQNNGSGNIVAYNGTTGALIGQVVPANLGSLTAQDGIGAMVFGPNGDLYFTKGLNDVFQYDPKTGQITDFINFSRPGPALAFGPDGNLYTGSDSLNSVLEFNGTTGAFMGTFVSAAETNGRVFDIAFSPASSVPVPSNFILLAGACLVIAWRWRRMAFMFL